MKPIFLFIVALLSLNLVFAQQVKVVLLNGSQNQIYEHRGAGAWDSGFYLLQGCGAPSAKVPIDLPQYMLFKRGVFLYKDTCGNHCYTSNTDATWTQLAAASGVGSPNSNLGAGYRLAIPNTNDLKTLFAGFGALFDSVSNANGLTITVDSLQFTTILKLYDVIDSLGATIVNAPIDSFAVQDSIALQERQFNYNGFNFRFINLIEQTSIDSSTSLMILQGDTSRRIAAGFFIPNTNNDKCLTGCTVTWDSVYTYTIAASTYYIDGIYHSSPQTSVTLSPADVTDNRIDVFVLQSNNTAGVVEGQAANPALEPDIDHTTQFKLSFAEVIANTTEPVITTDVIYHDNAQTPTEYNTAVNSIRINPNSTTNTFEGTKDVEGSLVQNGNNIVFDHVTAIDFSSVNDLVFKIASKGSWGNNKKLVFQWFNGVSAVGNSIVFGQNTYGFASAVTTYQNIDIPLSDFGNITGATKLRAQASNGSGTYGFYLDKIELVSSNNNSGATGVQNVLGIAPINVSTVSNTATVSLNNSGVSAGTYNNVTVTAKGIVSGGSNVSYLTSEADAIALAKTISANAGYGIIIPETATQALTIQPSWTFKVDTSNVSTKANVVSLLQTKQDQLNGTGFVKATGPVISYDNSVYVPTSRTLTINGVAQDLSSDRTWTVASSGGSPNSNIGSGHRLAVPNTNNIKTLHAGSNVAIDSVAVANELSISASDSTAYKTITQLTDSSFMLCRPNGTCDTVVFAGGASVDSIWRTVGVDSIKFSINGRYHAIKDSTAAGAALAATAIGYGSASNLLTGTADSLSYSIANRGITITNSQGGTTFTQMSASFPVLANTSALILQNTSPTSNATTLAGFSSPLISFGTHAYKSAVTAADQTGWFSIGAVGITGASVSANALQVYSTPNAASPAGGAWVLNISDAGLLTAKNNISAGSNSGTFLGNQLNSASGSSLTLKTGNALGSLLMQLGSNVNADIFQGSGNFGIFPEQAQSGTTDQGASFFTYRPASLGYGTVVNSAGGTTVTGTSTKFLNFLKVGDAITIQGETQTVSAIASNTSLTTTTWTNAHTTQNYSSTAQIGLAVNGNGNGGMATAAPNSTFDIEGSFALKYRSTAVDYTATNFNDHTIEVTATGKTVTLPTAVGCTGRIYTIKLTASGTGTVATTSSQTIDGSTTYSLSAQYKYVRVQSNGANWLIIGNN